MWCDKNQHLLLSYQVSLHGEPLCRTSCGLVLSRTWVITHRKQEITTLIYFIWDCFYSCITLRHTAAVTEPGSSEKEAYKRDKTRVCVRERVKLKKVTGLVLRSTKQTVKTELLRRSRQPLKFILKAVTSSQSSWNHLFPAPQFNIPGIKTLVFTVTSTCRRWSTSFMVLCPLCQRPQGFWRSFLEKKNTNGGRFKEENTAFREKKQPEQTRLISTWRLFFDHCE